MTAGPVLDDDLLDVFLETLQSPPPDSSVRPAGFGIRFRTEQFHPVRVGFLDPFLGYHLCVSMRRSCPLEDIDQEHPKCGTGKASPVTWHQVSS